MNAAERAKIRQARFVLAQCRGWVRVTGNPEGRNLLLPDIARAMSDLAELLGPGSEGENG